MSSHYWPGEGDDPETFGKVTVKKVAQQTHSDYVLRKFEIDEQKDQASSLLSIKTSFTVSLFQFKEWPEHKCPQEAAPIIDLINCVIKVQMTTGNKPIVVMCK